VDAAKAMVQHLFLARIHIHCIKEVKAICMNQENVRQGALFYNLIPDQAMTGEKLLLTRCFAVRIICASGESRASLWGDFHRER